MMNNEVIGIDCDEVILDFDEHFFTWLQSNDVEIPCYKPQEQEVLLRYGFTHEQGQAIFDRLDEEFWSTLPAKKGAIEALKQLQEKGYKVAVVTAIDPKLHDARMKNFAQLGWGPDALYPVGWGVCKNAVLQEHAMGVLIDDRLWHLEAAVHIGVKAIQVAPQEKVDSGFVKTRASEQIERVDSLEEAVKSLTAEAEKAVRVSAGLKRN